MAYDRPEQPPPCTPTRSPPSSVETPSFSRSARILRAARSVSVIFAIVGVASSVAITNPFQRLLTTLPASSQDAVANTVPESVACRRPRQPTLCTKRKGWAIQSLLVRDFCYGRDFDAMLLFPVADSRLDGVFGEHGTMNLHRREG